MDSESIVFVGQETPFEWRGAGEHEQKKEDALGENNPVVVSILQKKKNRTKLDNHLSQCRRFYKDGLNKNMDLLLYLATLGVCKHDGGWLCKIHQHISTALGFLFPRFHGSVEINNIRHCRLITKRSGIWQSCWGGSMK